MLDKSVRGWNFIIISGANLYNYPPIIIIIIIIKIKQLLWFKCNTFLISLKIQIKPYRNCSIGLIKVNTP